MFNPLSCPRLLRALVWFDASTGLLLGALHLLLTASLAEWLGCRPACWWCRRLVAGLLCCAGHPHCPCAHHAAWQPVGADRCEFRGRWPARRCCWHAVAPTFPASLSGGACGFRVAALPSCRDGVRRLPAWAAAWGKLLWTS